MRSCQLVMGPAGTGKVTLWALCGRCADAVGADAVVFAASARVGSPRTATTCTSSARRRAA